MRAFLTVIIPLLLPSAVYWMYLRIRQRQGLPFREIPYSWLIVAGTVLAIFSLGITWLYHGEEPNLRYVPPQVIDGVVVPGHFLPEEGAADGQ
ncbi:MAG: hypothetical protein JNL25_08020 [Rhodospirillaceae bacterium]|nr:hypothetical protein [Rhodospirillaceae bacterium]